MEIPDSRLQERVESEKQIIKVEKDEEKQNEIEPKKEKEK